MKRSLKFLRSAYRLLLNLYPQDFLAEFREELQTVFDLSLHDAMKKGRLEITAVVMRELISLPKAIVHEHLQQKRKVKMIRRLNARFDFAPGSISETLAALAPLLFLIVLTGGISLLISSIALFPVWLTSALAFLLVGLFFVLLLVGLVKGLPRWSLPYMGMLLAFYSVYGFSEFIYQYYGIYHMYETSWLMGVLTDQVYMWSGLAVVVFLLVMACTILPAFQRFRRDWTLLCFIVYGAAPFAVLLALDDYQQAEPYMLLALLVQIVGVWYYLHTNGRWKRFLILLGGLTLSMWTVAVSKLILGPLQPWFRGQGLEWWGPEMMSPIMMWVWLAVSMLIPSVIHFFPRIRKPVPVG